MFFVPNLPVVLVHGFLSSPELLAPMVARLRARGHDVHTTKLGLLCIQDVREHARELAENIDRILGETGASKCHLVGVSQGGIISLHYLKHLDGGQKVSAFVSVASPFLGSWAPVVGLLGAPFLGWVSKGVWQVIPGNELLRGLAEAPMPEGVAFTSIAIEGDLVAPPKRCALPEARTVTVGGLPVVAHQWLIISPEVVEAIDEALREASSETP